MAWKVLTFLAIFALSEARPPTSEQRVKIENWLSHIRSHEPKPQEEYASSYPSYEFTYEVSDPHTHDFKGQHEQRKGDDVKGYYWLIQPDGLKRTVKYRADKHSGFNADVEYTKYWEKENERQEGEVNEEENNSSESENSEESENGQENENAARNENEAEGEGESGGEEGENNEEEEETEESENQEGEQSELREEHWKRGGYNLNRGNYKRSDNARGRELKATVGIWQPKYWSKRYRNEETRHVRSNESNKENEKHGRGKRGKKGKKEERRQEIQKNENSEQNEKNKKEQKEQQSEGNDNAEGRIESNHKDKSLKKSEYHVIIHHPKALKQQ